ncbi:MAG: Valine-tRNA ligase [Candidatus Magasanikbacteria bacterium GW2011_GWA2_37_8]|uniref:Valine--tRNA ligase n=1 Tax=Candidatus Magasanikbacteria bacterium GW2011_GWA2_37_8 TaxID=1619036 RepID=A0A0G0HQE0_9BACT|nr:MAG: Valine-tRNA ligase [Candidatus Magasanikbacteria bacterium GW2011_GWA2_37_8]
MKELPKAYEPEQYEDKIYTRWEESGFFNPDKCDKEGKCTTGKSFSIVLPPPNVTGTLHIGHASMLAIQDLMIRYHRMKGDRTLWVPGTDHAAIATQTKVEKLLMERGIKEPKKELGREKFLEEVNKFAKESHDTIVNQSKKMGSSLDWSREAFTLDEPRNLAVKTVFKKMYDDGLIYRGYRIVNWCPRCHSTLADDEVEHKTSQGKMYWIKYGPFILATTRPETKLGDTAVAVNPNDNRYKDMVGKKYMIPGVLGEFEIIVVADDAVDIEFGSGAVKVTPYHSFTDYEIAQRHGIVGKQIIDEDGKMMANCGKYAGMTTLEARTAIVKDMEKMGLIDHVEDYENNLSICYRCGHAIEPIPSKQWFIDVNKRFKLEKSKLKNIKDGQEVSLKELMQTVVKSEQIEIVPERFDKIYFHWIDNLRDWCISRQIWYGHQIPVWYKGDEIFVGIEAPDEDGWLQDPDTLDTWFSSGLWTFSTLGWPNETEDLKNFHPTTVMETGYDILFFWVARMILMTTYTLGDIPFEKVYLHGLVRDEQGRKMSKSLGNVIDPLDVCKEYGTDAVRLSLLIGNTPGNDCKLSEEKIAGFRNFSNKLWNISRFILTQIEDNKYQIIDKPTPKTLADKWILVNLGIVIYEVSKNIEKFQFSQAGELLRDFTWNELADWYLEIAKIEGDKSEILNYILSVILKLWHPFMPFVTEQIWTEIYGEERMLIVEKWPTIQKTSLQEEAVDFGCTSIDFQLIQDIIAGIRSLRAENKIEPVKKLNVVISAGGKKDLLEENSEIIKTLARLENLQIEESATKPAGSIGFVKSGVEIFVDLSGAIDVEKEKIRLEKEKQELGIYIKGLGGKLDNKEFVNNAPPAVVEKEQQKLNEAKDKLIKLNSQLEGLN